MTQIVDPSACTPTLHYQFAMFKLIVHWFFLMISVLCLTYRYVSRTLSSSFHTNARSDHQSISHHSSLDKVCAGGVRDRVTCVEICDTLSSLPVW
ncbi:hypothetical protein M405DRAFT_246947 [Rhizopogon salebrosus TDB-379]|nr:hypothetical protein M405DRAFT_246947 [Rhizopogon salebrosus TDB-379]